MDSQVVFNRLRQFDAYPKTLEDFRVKTFSGAAGKFVWLSQLPNIAVPIGNPDIMVIVPNMLFNVI